MGQTDGQDTDAEGGTRDQHRAAEGMTGGTNQKAAGFGSLPTGFTLDSSWTDSLHNSTCGSL